MRLGLVSNLRSQRNRRGIDALERVLAGRREVLHRKIQGVEGLDQVLTEFAAADVEVVAVNGGDGTVQAVCSLLINANPFAGTPPLAVLSGGMTNMIAEDVGSRGAPAAAAQKLCAKLAQGDWSKDIVSRPLVGMQLRPGATPIYGTFFGTSSIYRAILYAREHVHSKKVESNLAAGLTLTRLLLGSAFARGSTQRILKGEEISVQFDDGTVDAGAQLLSLVTGMERLVLGSRPFWGSGAGALHYTRIAAPAPRLLRNGYRLLYGGAKRKLAPAEVYFSRKADGMSVSLSEPFTLDGELFTPEPDTPVLLRGDKRVEFLRI